MMRYKFSAKIESDTTVLGVHYFITVPESVWSDFEKPQNFRLECLINGIIFNPAFLSNGSGGYSIRVSRDLLRQAKVSVAEKADFELYPDPNGDEIILPEELIAVFEQEPEAKIIFDGFTAGRRRSILTVFKSAKSQETRIKRALHLVEVLLEGKSHNIPQKKKKDQE